MPDWAFTTFTAISSIFLLSPLYFICRKPSSPWSAILLIVWVLILNILSAVESIIWASANTDGWSLCLIYCDISSRLKEEAPVAIPSLAASVLHFLCQGADPEPRSAHLRAGGWKSNTLDLCLGVGLPIIHAGLKYLVTPWRYTIMGVAGCTGSIDTGLVALFLYSIWPPVASFIAAVFAGTAVFLPSDLVRFIFRITRSRKRINENSRPGPPTGIPLNEPGLTKIESSTVIGFLKRKMKNSGFIRRGGVTSAEFFRISISVLLVVLVFFPISIASCIVLYMSVPMDGYSFHKVHGPYWPLIHEKPLDKAPWVLWIYPLLAFDLFIFHGLTRDARQSYILWFKTMWALIKRPGLPVSSRAILQVLFPEFLR